jgi:hypothetical protein
MQPGDRVRLTPEHAADRSASSRARKDCATRPAYVVWGDNRHADREQICVLEKIE